MDMSMRIDVSIVSLAFVPHESVISCLKVSFAVVIIVVVSTFAINGFEMSSSLYGT